MRLRRLGERAIGSGRNPVAEHERFGEILRAFELRRGARWPEDAQARGAECVDDASSERSLRADDRQRGLLGSSERNQLLGVGDRDIGQPRLERRSSVTRGDEDLPNPRRTRDLPGKRVFAAAGADDEHVHRAASPLAARAAALISGLSCRRSTGRCRD